MMSSERKGIEAHEADAANTTAERDARTGQSVEEEEKNLSRHSTSDSSPSVAEQERTTLPEEDA